MNLENTDNSNINFEEYEEISDNTAEYEEINENTVEYKVVNRYNRNNNILNKIYYENHPDYLILLDYLKPFMLSKDSTIKANITCPGGRYYIDNESYSRFFELLQICSKNKLILHFREVQLNDYINKKGSGIMFDFDLLQEEDKNELKLKSFDLFLTRMLEIMEDLLIIDKTDQFYITITVKKTLVYKEDKKLYKNGFHILIPEVMLARPAKKLLFYKMLNDPELKQFFKEQFKNELKEGIFDIGSVSVPVYLMYNCKEDSTEPYEILRIYRSSFRRNVTIYNESLENLIPTYNMISELSINFRGSLMKNRYYELKEEYHLKVLDTLNKTNSFDVEKEETICTFNTFNSYVEDNLDYYRKIVEDILDIKRAEDRNLWRNVIFALANINVQLRPAFKPIAKLFSMRAESKYNTEEFERMWATACNNDENNSKLTMKSLIYWAIEDNNVKFKKILNKDIHNTIELDVYCRDNRILNGTLYQFHYAYYIYHLFKQKFVYDVDSTGKNGQWYEFVLESDTCDKGEIFKWRAEHEPDNLILYMSNKLPNIISNVVKKAETSIENNPDDEDRNNYIISRTKNLKKASQGLYKTDFKNGVIKEAKCFFRSRGFIKKLNSDQNIMGVGNGVLELSTNPKLIRHYHNYHISLFTETDYVPYNPTNPHVIKLLNVILGMFPKNELDAFHWIMYYLATCLDGKPKDSIILILTGKGANGKSAFSELIKSVLGQYGAKMSMSFLTEARGRSSGADEELMKLKIARLAYYSETEKNEALNTAKLKELTSQESMAGRGIFEKAQIFRPTCSHMVTTNYQFSIKTTDHGIWRRIVTYEFKMKFCDNPDPDNEFEKLNDPEIAKEFSFNPEIKNAFLSILVEYYKDLHLNHKGELKNILKPTIDKEVAIYRNKEDVLNRFIDEFCIYSPDSKTCLSEIVDKYENWYEANIGRNGKPEKSEIYNQLQNSKLVKYIKKVSTRVILQNIRYIDDMIPDGNDVLTEDEYYIRDIATHNTRNSQIPAYNINKFNPLNL